MHFGKCREIERAVANLDDTEVVHLVKHVIGEYAVTEGIYLLGSVPAHLAQLHSTVGNGIEIFFEVEQIGEITLEYEVAQALDALLETSKRDKFILSQLDFAFHALVIDDAENADSIVAVYDMEKRFHQEIAPPLQFTLFGIGAIATVADDDTEFAHSRLFLAECFALFTGGFTAYLLAAVLQGIAPKFELAEDL